QAVKPAPNRFSPRPRQQAAFMANHGCGYPSTAGQIMKTVTSLVAKPMAIDRFVDPRLKTIDVVLIGFDADIAAGAATGSDGRRFLQIPDANFEAEIAVRQRAHWT